MPKTEPIQTLLDKETADKLKQVAAREHRKVSDYVRILIEQDLANK